MILNPFNLGSVVPAGSWDLTCLAPGELHAHYDFTDAANMTLSGTDVLTVTDLSGNGFTLAPTVNSPNWNAGSSLVEFDKTNTEDLAATLGAGGTDYGAYIVVMEPKAITAGFSRFVGFSSSSNEDTFTDTIIPFTAFLGNVRSKSNGGSDIVTASGLNNGLEVWTLKATTSGYEMYQNGLSIGSFTLGTKRISFEDEITIGRGTSNVFVTDMDIKEFILLKGDVSDNTIESVEWYLADKYGYTLDAGHPYNASSPVPCNVVVTPPVFDMDSAWKIFLNGANQADWVTTTGLDGNEYFVETEDSISGNSISINSAFYDPNQNIGFYITANGLYMNANENATLFFSMASGADTSALAHADSSFTIGFVYNYDGNTNGSNYKHWAGGRKGFKIEGATNGINIADTFNTAADGTGTASSGETFQFDPANGSYTIATANPFFFCISRVIDPFGDNKYLIYTGELTGSATLSDLKVHDTISDSGWYLTNPYSNVNDEIEFAVDDDSILHAWFYNNEAVIESSIENTYLYMDQLFG